MQQRRKIALNEAGQVKTDLLASWVAASPESKEQLAVHWKLKQYHFGDAAEEDCSNVGPGCERMQQQLRWFSICKNIVGIRRIRMRYCCFHQALLHHQSTGKEGWRMIGCWDDIRKTYLNPLSTSDMLA